MGKNKKQKNKKYSMDVDDATDTAPKGTGADFMAIDEETKKQMRDSLAVKVKPKRGKSSRKQKQRLAIKFDKMRQKFPKDMPKEARLGTGDQRQECCQKPEEVTQEHTEAVPEAPLEQQGQASKQLPQWEATYDPSTRSKGMTARALISSRPYRH